MKFRKDRRQANKYYRRFWLIIIIIFLMILLISYIYLRNPYLIFILAMIIIFAGSFYFEGNGITKLEIDEDFKTIFINGLGFREFFRAFCGSAAALREGEQHNTREGDHQSFLHGVDV